MEGDFVCIIFLMCCWIKSEGNHFSSGYQKLFLVLQFWFPWTAFTEVPVDLAAFVAHNCLKRDQSEDCTLLSPDETASLLSFCLDATYFTFIRDSTSKYLARLWGPLVAVKLVMDDVEQNALNLFEGKLSIWKRYVTCSQLYNEIS